MLLLPPVSTLTDPRLPSPTLSRSRACRIGWCTCSAPKARAWTPPCPTPATCACRSPALARSKASTSPRPPPCCWRSGQQPDDAWRPSPDGKQGTSPSHVYGRRCPEAPGTRDAILAWIGPVTAPSSSRPIALAQALTLLYATAGVRSEEHTSELQ